jgi:hypothetical protein
MWTVNITLQLVLNVLLLLMLPQLTICVLLLLLLLLLLPSTTRRCTSSRSSTAAASSCLTTDRQLRTWVSAGVIAENNPCAQQSLCKTIPAGDAQW